METNVGARASAKAGDMDLRDRVIARYVLKTAGQIVDPVAVSSDMAARLGKFGTFEPHLRKLQQGCEPHRSTKPQRLRHPVCGQKP